MATTTPNFGWPVPTSTDLVKDGATAIEGLGDAIDASLLDLKGGTSGQVLAKNSNTDMDFVWVAQDDSNAIQNAIVDAKGDLIAATAADTPARLAVGTNGQILTADSTAATGLKWASGSTPAFVGCFLRKTANQSISNSTDTAQTWDVEDIDTDAFHSTATNTARITIPSGKDGKYLVTAQVRFEASNTTGRRISRIYKNGSLDASFQWETAPTTLGAVTTGNSFIEVLAAGDYIELYAFQTSGGTINTLFEGSYFGLEYLGA